MRCLALSDPIYSILFFLLFLFIYLFFFTLSHHLHYNTQVTHYLHPCSTSHLQFYTLFILPSLQETNKQNKTNTEINMYHLLEL